LLEQRIGICYGGGRAGGAFYTEGKEQSKFAIPLLEMKVKLSLYRPGPALRAPGVSGFLDF
jgi:hypothetical protein